MSPSGDAHPGVRYGNFNSNDVFPELESRHRRRECVQIADVFFARQDFARGRWCKFEVCLAFGNRAKICIFHAQTDLEKESTIQCHHELTKLEDY
jgi:hypothetical protein